MARPWWMKLTLGVLTRALVPLLIPLGASQAADPALPPGTDPGGTLIALITEGVDYTDPQIARRLARDGEGQMIGWDFVDNDIKPFSSDSHGTELAKLLLKTNTKSRLVIVRVDPQNAQHLARAVTFINRTPAKIVAVPFQGLSEQRWSLFVQVALKSTRLLFVLPAGDVEHLARATPVWPAAANLPNAIRAAPLVPFDAMKLKGGASFAKVDASVDAWVLPGGLHAELLSGSKFPPPTTSSEAVVVVAALVGCFGKPGSFERTGNKLRAAFMARDPKHKGSKNHEPFCRN